MCIAFSEPNPDLFLERVGSAEQLLEWFDFEAVETLSPDLWQSSGQLASILCSVHTGKAYKPIDFIPVERVQTREEQIAIFQAAIKSATTK